MSSNNDCTPKRGEFRRGARRKTVPNALEFRVVKRRVGYARSSGRRAGAGVCRKRSNGDVQSGVGFDFDAAHPDYVAVAFEDRPRGAVGSGNFHTLKHFLDFSEVGGMAQANAVAGLPGSEEGRCGRVGELVGCRRDFDAEEDSVGGGRDFAGYGHGVLGCNFRTVGGCGRKGSGGQAQLSVGAFGAESVGELELLTGAADEGEGAQGFSGREVGRGAELLGGMAEKAALDSGREVGEAGNVEGEAIAGGASAAAHGTAGKDQLRRDAGDFGTPPGFLVAGEGGHLRHVFAETGIPCFEEREEFVTDAIAGKGDVAVGGVFAPGLVNGVKVRFDFDAGGGEKRADNATFGKFKDGMNAGETFSPRAAQEFGENGFSLIIEGVGGGDCVECRFVGRSFGQ